MLLRHLVSQFIRSAAGQRIFEEVSNAARGKQHHHRPDGDEGTRPPSHQPEPKPCEVAFVFALGIESGGLVDLARDVVTSRCPSFVEHVGSLDGRQIVIADSGVGRVKAAQATDELIVMHKPSWVVSAGFAGALRDGLKRGHILMADHVADCDGHQLAIGLSIDPQVIESTKGLHVDRLLTVDELVRSPQEKRALGQRHSAAACDMETMAAASVCRNHAVRFLSVRVISDTVDDYLPQEIEKMVGQKTLARKLGAAVGAIVNRPSAVKDMWKLKEDAFKASDRLARFLVGVTSQLTGVDR